MGLDNEDLTYLPDRIAEIFYGRTVLITGGSGFLGKILIEKLLRECDIKQIYLLVRTKKEKAPKERLNDILKNVLFDNLQQQRPNVFKKCSIIAGDLNEVDLGLQLEDRKIIQKEVDFIYHSAASTRFDDTLRVAVRINTRGTKYMLDLAHQCQKLKLFVHVSTAYAFPNQEILLEEPYNAPANPHEVLGQIEFEKEDDTGRTHKLLGNCPNTYTYSKALAEALVLEQYENLPVLIIRPSVVCPIWKQPIPGWCNNLQGPMGLFVGAGKGIIRSMYVNSESFANFIPADVVINAMMVSTWYSLTQEKLVIGNCVSPPDFNYSWEEIVNLGKDIVLKEVPFNGVVWYPGGSMKKSKFIHNICFFLFQIIPALFIDGLLILLGYKPILYQIQRRIEKGAEVFEYYTTRNWKFSETISEKLRSKMNDREKHIYKIDGDGLDVKEYFRNCIMSVRRNNLKETDAMLPAAKRNLKIMWALDISCKIGFIIMTLYYFLHQFIY